MPTSCVWVFRKVDKKVSLRICLRINNVISVHALQWQMKCECKIGIRSWSLEWRKISAGNSQLYEHSADISIFIESTSKCSCAKQSANLKEHMQCVVISDQRISQMRRDAHQFASWNKGICELKAVEQTLDNFNVFLCINTVYKWYLTNKFYILEDMS